MKAVCRRYRIGILVDQKVKSNPVLPRKGAGLFGIVLRNTPKGPACRTSDLRINLLNKGKRKLARRARCLIENQHDRTALERLGEAVAAPVRGFQLEERSGGSNRNLDHLSLQYNSPALAIRSAYDIWPRSRVSANSDENTYGGAARPSPNFEKIRNVK